MNTRQHILGRFFAAALLAALCGTAANVATAATTEVKRSIVVRFGDLNLAREEGVQQLYNRIRAAATRVCSETGAAVKTSSLSYRKCRGQAIDVAVAKINNGILTAMHEQQKPSRRFG